MKTVKALREELNDLLDEAKALTDVPKAENRDLTEDELTRFNALTEDEDDKKGVIAQKKIELLEAEKHERRKKALAMERAESLRAANPLGGEDAENPAPMADVRHVIAQPRCFKGKDAIRNAYAAGLYLKALVARDKGRPDEALEAECERRGMGSVRAAATESSATAGGYLVPAELSSAIISVRNEVGVSRRLARVMPMMADTLDVPRRTSGLTVYAPGEATAITASDKVWSKVALVAKKRAVAAQLSQELQDDAIIGVVDDAMQEMAYALADQEDSEFINGDGTATYFGVQGLLSKIGSSGVATAATGNDTWPELTTNDVAAWFGKLPSKHRVRGQLAIVCSTNFYHSALLRILMAGGGNSIAALQAGETSDAMFMGYPVYFTDKMPTATAAATVCALFGNFGRSVIIGDRTEVRMALSKDYAFLSDLDTLKATVRYDINVFDYGDGSSSPGGYVALKTAS